MSGDIFGRHTWGGAEGEAAVGIQCVQAWQGCCSISYIAPDGPSPQRTTRSQMSVVPRLRKFAQDYEPHKVSDCV